MKNLRGSHTHILPLPRRISVTPEPLVALSAGSWCTCALRMRSTELALVCQTLQQTAQDPSPAPHHPLLWLRTFACFPLSNCRVQWKSPLTHGYGTKGKVAKNLFNIVSQWRYWLFLIATVNLSIAFEINVYQVRALR